MLYVHHLNHSRSQRILWLLEELNQPYEIVHYERQSPIPIAPPSLKKIHPLGKSPVIVDDGCTIAESGAIIEYILEKFGNGRMRPEKNSNDYISYLEWLHYAEGSAMMPFLMKWYLRKLGEHAAPLNPRIDSETNNHLSYIASALYDRDYLIGNALSDADIQMVFVLEVAEMHGLLKDFLVLQHYLMRIKARPAYQRAIEKGGPYNLMQQK